jgi:hypothetical protein
MGSTSYDGVEEEPFEPDWAGGSWYGAGSGTYWRVNPKEYADPRKHGPEYQARGRHRPDGTGTARPDASATSPAGGASGASPAGSWTEASNPGWSAGTTTGRPGEATGRAGAASRGEARTADQAWTDRRRASGDQAPGGGWQQAWPDEFAPLDEEGRGGLAVPSWFSGPVARRVVPILLGWPPIGFVLAALVGELTGCGRFSAGCSDSAGILPWLLQPLVIGLLLALPFLANIAAIGTLGALLAAIPVAAVLSVTGGGRGPVFTTSMVLVVALATGYLVGAVGAGIGRFRLPDASPQPLNHSP